MICSVVMPAVDSLAENVCVERRVMTGLASSMLATERTAVMMVAKVIAASVRAGNCARIIFASSTGVTARNVGMMGARVTAANVSAAKSVLRGSVSEGLVRASSVVPTTVEEAVAPAPKGSIVYRPGNVKPVVCSHATALPAVPTVAEDGVGSVRRMTSALTLVPVLESARQTAMVVNVVGMGAVVAAAIAPSMSIATLGHAVLTVRPIVLQRPAETTGVEVVAANVMSLFYV